MPKWGTLARNTAEVSPGSIDNASQAARISHLDLRYNKNFKTLTFYGEVRSTNGFAGHSVMLVFKNVKREDGLTKEELAAGYQPKPSLSKHEVMMRCSCASYRFRFDYANRSHGVGTGAKFKIYHKKTNRKPNNPYNLPGFCKHALEFVTYLQQQGFIL